MPQREPRPLPRLIKLWFLFDALLVLAPPLHWAVNGHAGRVLGLPATLLYFLAVSSFVALSVVAAYLQEDHGREAS